MDNEKNILNNDFNVFTVQNEQVGALHIDLVKYYENDQELNNLLSLPPNEALFKRKENSERESIATSDLEINIINNGRSILFEVAFSNSKNNFAFTGELSSNSSFDVIKKYLDEGKELALALISPSKEILLTGIKHNNIIPVRLDDGSLYPFRQTVSLKYVN